MFRLTSRTVSAIAAQLMWLPFVAQSQTRVPHVQAIRFWSFGDVTRVAVQTDGDYTLASDQIPNPNRVYFDLSGLNPPPGRRRGAQAIHVGDHLVKQIRVAELSPGKTRIVFDLEAPVEVSSSQLVNPDRLMIELRPKGTGLPAGPSVTRSVTASERIDLPPADFQPMEEIATIPVGIPLATVPKELPRPGNLALANLSTPAVRRAIPPDMSKIAPPPYVSSTPHTDSPSPGLDAIATAPLDHDRLSPPPAPGRTQQSSLIQQAKSAPSTLPDRRTGSRSVSDMPAPAKTDSFGDRSLVRVFGLKLGKVVIDAGHGGHDTGTVGPNGLMEKDLVLDVALRLGKLIQQQLAAEVVYTRSEDVFLPLEQRTKIANEERADLFISIHANSSPVSSATGVETYYFNFTSDQIGLDLATRENATSTSSISDLNDLLHKAVLKTKVEESREFAQKVQASLSGMSVKMNNRSRDRGVRRAPFVVLIGATMPSILAEIGFVSNPHDALLMKKNEQRQKIADALFKGVSQYASSLSHVQIARAKPTE